MKKLVLILGLAGFLTHLNAQSIADNDTLKNHFRVSFSKFFLSTMGLEYERDFNNRTSAVVFSDVIVSSSVDDESIGVRGGLQYRIYTLNEPYPIWFASIDGMYLGPYVSYRYADVKDLYNNISNTYQALNGGILIGLRFKAFDKISGDFHVGGGIQYSFNSDDEDYYYLFEVYEPDYTGIKPMANISVGIRF